MAIVDGQLATAADVNAALAQRLSLSGGTVGPLYYTATGGTASRSAQNRAVDVANVLDFGADPTGGVDSSDAFRLAIATGKSVFVPSGFYKIYKQLTLAESQTLSGAGRGNTLLLVDQNFDPAASSVILCGSSADYGVTICDLGIVFSQPDDVTSRSTLKTLAAGGTSVHGGTGVQYPWAIYGPNGSGRIKVQNVQVRGAWNGFLFDTVFWIDNIEMGAAGTGLAQAINNSVADWSFVGTYEHWPYGWNTTGQVGIFLDGQTIAIQCGSASNPSFQTGIQGQSISNLGGRIIFHDSGWSTITNLNNDGDTSSLEVNGQLFLEITNFYYTAGTAAIRPGISVLSTDGPARLFIHNIYAHSSSNYPIASVSGGGELHILGLFVIYYTLNQPAIIVSNGVAKLFGGRIIAGGGTRTAPLIQQTGGVLVIGDGMEFTGSNGSAVSFAIDYLGNYLGNIILGTGMTVSVPSTVTNGYYFGYSDIATHGVIGTGSNTLAGQIGINGPSASARWLAYTSSGVGRWWIGINSSGDDLSIVNANDAGVPIGNVLVISRATGIITGNPVFGDTVTIGQLNVGNGGGQHLIANNGGVNFAKIFACQTGGLERWQWGSDTSTESGSNAGANFFLSRYNDAGTSIGNPLAIVRSSGAFIMADLQVSTSYANDAAAATGGVALGQLYRNGSVVQIRVT